MNKFVLQRHILMGGNLNSILTRISLDQLLESIASKLNNGKDYSEIIRKV